MIRYLMIAGLLFFQLAAHSQIKIDIVDFVPNKYLNNRYFATILFENNSDTTFYLLKDDLTSVQTDIVWGDKADTNSTAYITNTGVIFSKEVSNAGVFDDYFTTSEERINGLSLENRKEAENDKFRKKIRNEYYYAVKPRSTTKLTMTLYFFYGATDDYWGLSKQTYDKLTMSLSVKLHCANNRSNASNTIWLSTGESARLKEKLFKSLNHGN